MHLGMATGSLKVQLSADAYLACLTHALSAEKEEIMGVLLGEVSNIASRVNRKREGPLLLTPGSMYC